MTQAVTVLNDNGQSPFLLTADHASAAIPDEFDNLGLCNEQADAVLCSHRAFDIGAQEMTETLANALDATAVMSNYSRLVADVNRHPHDPTFIRPIYDNQIIPGNIPLSDDARRARTEKFFDPFHHALTEQIMRRRARAQPTLLICIHSFTPMLQDGVKRPQDIALLYHQPPHFLPAALAFLAREGWCVGDNQPYSSRGVFGYTLARHGTANDIPAVSIEYRQDHLQDDGGFQRFLTLTMELLTRLTGEAQIPRNPQGE